MLNEEQIADIWTMFKEYVDKKQVDLVAERFVDLLADYGVSDETFRDLIGLADNELDSAISYYLEIDDDLEEDYEDD